MDDLIRHSNTKQLGFYINKNFFILFICSTNAIDDS
jgi:hypothetical protein